MTLISDPNGFATGVASDTASFVTQLTPMAELVIGVLLAALVLGLLIRIFHR